MQFTPVAGVRAGRCGQAGDGHGRFVPAAVPTKAWPVVV